MTLRSIILGLLGAAGICGATFFNDRILRGTYLIGNNFPISVYGLLILFALAINPYLRRLRLKGGEIAVILLMTLAACTIPSSGLLRTFPGVCILPRQYEKTEAGWRGGEALVRERDVRDWDVLYEELRAGVASPDGIAGAVWRRLDPDVQARLQAGVPTGEDTLRGPLIDAFAAILEDTDFPRASFRDPARLTEHVLWLMERDPEALDAGDLAVLNRGLLDAAFPGGLEARVPGVVEQMPKRMLADYGQDEDTVLGGFIQGMGEGGEHISPARVPWGAWVETLAFWVPIALCMWGILLALSLVFHRQWSRHEHLPYPIANFTNTLFPEGAGGAPLFRERMFWIGTILVLLIHLNNYACVWFPDYLIPINVRIDLSSLAYQLMPTLTRGGGGWILNAKVYFIVIGIAFFIPTDVSLGFAIGPVLFAYIVGLLAAYGVSLDGTLEGSSWWMGLKPKAFVIFGSVLGVFCSLVYTGRNHYASIVCRSLGIQKGDQVEPAEIWGFRAAVVLTLLLVLQLAVSAGVGVPVAVLYTGIMLIAFVVTSRVVAETGLFHLQIAVFPCVILWGLFGARAIGPGALLVLQMVSIVLLIDTRETLMPFLANSFKVLELRRIKLGRAGAVAALAVVVGLGVGLPITMYIQYDHGRTWDRWAEEMVPKMPFENAVSVQNKLAGQGALDVGPGQLGKLNLAGLAPNSICVWALAIGFVLVVAFTFARLRYAWWPLHPLMFAIWATGHIKHFAGAFFIGWLIKVFVTKYGGSHTYNKVKPLMMGFIAGEVLGAVVPCIVGAIYYFITGEPPKAFLVLPG